MNMKNIKTKIILSAIIFLSVIGFGGTVDAAGAYLYVSPATLTKTTGNVFSVSVGINTSGSKVCAIEGSLVFNNLSCQSITVASDAMAQSLPTCSTPYFLIGIPNCTTLGKILLTVSVKAGSAGTSSVVPIGVDIIGEGASLGSASISGIYTINAVPAPVQVEKPPASPVEETPVSPVEETAIPSSSPALFDVITQPEVKQPQKDFLTPIIAGIGILIIVIAGYIIYKKRKREIV